jgi:hypothetical protein
MLPLQRSLLALVAGLVVTPLAGMAPVYADGAASTRNIIFGAAAAAGTLLVINHNKKVHQRYAEDAARQAALERQRDDVQAAYDAERRAYAHEADLVASYQHEVTIQHDELQRERLQLASLHHQLAMTSGHQVQTAFAPAPAHEARPQAPAAAPEVVSYGWGTL